LLHFKRRKELVDLQKMKNIVENATMLFSKHGKLLQAWPSGLQRDVAPATSGSLSVV
jgi:hypothetical protein